MESQQNANSKITLLYTLYLQQKVLLTSNSSLSDSDN